MDGDGEGARLGVTGASGAGVGALGTEFTSQLGRVGHKACHDAMWGTKRLL